MSVRSATALMAASSVTVFLSVAAANAGMWRFTPFLLIPSVVAFVLGLFVVLVVARFGGSLDAGTVAALVTVLLMVSGGSVLEPLGAWGVPAVGLVAGATYRLASRLLRAFDLRWFVRWSTVALLVINGAFAIQLGLGDSYETPLRQSAIPDPTAHVDAYPDVVVLILDEFGSLATTPLRTVDRGRVLSLKTIGFDVREEIWAPYTVSAAAVPAVLDGSYPVVEGDLMDRSTVRSLGAISRGENRLVQTLKSLGYRFTQVESGLWMSSCGPSVDVCVESHPVSEMMGTLLHRSAFRWWYERYWGSAFTASGLHSMTATREVLLEHADNGQPDLVVSHIMLPHLPYLLDAECETHGRTHDDYTTLDLRLAGYQLQAGCVVDWLVEVLTELDLVSAQRPAVVAVGDHGTDFSGKLQLPLKSWTDDDVAERLAAFAAYRFPGTCPDKSVASTPQLVDNLIACLGGGAPSLDRRHFLISYAVDPAVVREYPWYRLDDLSAALGS